LSSAFSEMPLSCQNPFVSIFLTMALRGAAVAFMVVHHETGCLLPNLCQNCVKTPSVWGVGSCYFEREQPPQVIDIRHFRIELMERLEPEHIFRNQQVAGSIPAGGSIPNL